MADKPKATKRNKKDAQLLIRISTAEREQFLQLCEQLDTSAAREIRQFIRAFVEQNASGECHGSKETVDVEENQSRRRKKSVLTQAADQGL